GGGLPCWWGYGGVTRSTRRVRYFRRWRRVGDKDLQQFFTSLSFTPPERMIENVSGNSLPDLAPIMHFPPCSASPRDTRRSRTGRSRQCTSHLRRTCGLIHAEVRRRGRGKLVYDAIQSLLQGCCSKVDEQSDGQLRQAKVGEQLFSVYGRQRLD